MSIKRLHSHPILDVPSDVEIPFFLEWLGVDRQGGGDADLSLPTGGAL
jgi:hypothetical protein